MVEVIKILNDLFSDDGFCTDYFCVKADKNGVVVSLTASNEEYMIEFGDKKPQVILNKVIKINVDLNYIKLTPKRGYISVGILPAIPFKYSWVFSHKTEIENN